MCGRFTLTVEAREVLAEFGVEPPEDYRPRYNIAPTQRILAVAQGENGWIPIEPVWGLVPHWSRDGRGAQLRINARAETVSTKPSYRDSFQNRRCLVLADGFFEWQGEGKYRRPMLIRRRDGRPYAFAGLWDRWTAADGSALFSCTILTTSANELVRSIHDRMPVMLNARHRVGWLDAASTPTELSAMLQPAPAGELEYYPVSSVVNSPHNDVPECVFPV